jgi:large subunit ribosomal protein L2|tara:strand:+ start:6289 stop:7119 length:831 start_codon:yes stop_codon:yes gene_type:complete
MPIRFYNACTPGTRTRSVSKFTELTGSKPERSLIGKNSYSHGRNNRGVITSRKKGGGHKRRYRIIDFNRRKVNVLAKISSIDYDPNRNARVALLKYEDGIKSYILHPRLLEVGSFVCSGVTASFDVGNALPISQIPLGTFVHNIELIPGQGGKLVRAAGTSAQILAKANSFVTVKLPSGEVRLIRGNCFATIGQLGNIDSNAIVIGKAGAQRWRGRRPIVRGVVKNPIDHPHGGGEGRSPIGRKHPVTPWGKPALGVRTRKKRKYSDNYIVRRRKS